MAEDSWQPAPPIASGWPVTLQIGTVGAGIGIGCGVGVGFGGPLSLGSIPALGQAAQGISAGMGGLNSLLGGAGAAARAAVRGLGIQGLDAGFGCGVGLGYGFGAGLMLKPSVVEQVVTAGSQLIGQMSSTLSSGMQQAGTQQPASSSLNQQALPGGSSSSSSAHGPYFNNNSMFAGPVPATAAIQPRSVGLHETSTPGVHGSSSRDSSSAAAGMPSSGSRGGGDALFTAAGQQIESSSSAAQQDPVILHTLLLQQQDIALLKLQNKQLRQAVCRLDPKAPFCSGRNNSSRRSNRGAAGSGFSSSDGCSK